MQLYKEYHREAVIVSTARTPIGKAFRGAFNDTEAPVLGGHVIRAALDKAGVAGPRGDDVILGIAAQQGNQGYNLGRLCCYTAGLPDSVGGMAIDRMCASGLMSIATAAKGIMTGEYMVAVAGGWSRSRWCRTSTRTATARNPRRCWRRQPRPTSR